MLEASDVDFPLEHSSCPSEIVLICGQLETPALHFSSKPPPSSTCWLMSRGSLISSTKDSPHTLLSTCSVTISKSGDQLLKESSGKYMIIAQKSFQLLSLTSQRIPFCLKSFRNSSQPLVFSPFDPNFNKSLLGHIWR